MSPSKRPGVPAVTRPSGGGRPLLADAAALGPLSPAEKTELARHEKVIASGLQSFVEVGAALVAVQEQKLYRGTHGSFQEYLRDKWNLSRPRGYELIGASAVVSAMADTNPELPAPPNARVARALKEVPEEQRPEVWAAVVEESKRTETAPTAAAVERAARPAEPVQDVSTLPPRGKAKSAGPAPVKNLTPKRTHLEELVAELATMPDARNVDAAARGWFDRRLGDLSDRDLRDAVSYWLTTVEALRRGAEQQSA